ncbi:MAG: hypothetical protein ACEPOZ_21055 [Marinifilaceae bacterium]
MKNLKLLGILMIFFATCGQVANAQGNKYKASDRIDRISMQVGAGFNYTMWGGFSKSFKSQAISSHFSGMLGYRFRDLSRRKKVAGVFVNYGNVAGLMTDRTVDFNRLNIEHQPDAKGSFLETEVGMINNGFRISGGLGRQKIDMKDGSTTNFDYYLVTIGGTPSYRNVDIILGLSMLFGEDVRKITFRPTIGIAYRLDFLKTAARRSSSSGYRYNSFRDRN